MSTLQRYSSYKESGVEWLGEIPEHWEVKKLKYVMTYQKGKNPVSFTNIPNDNIYLSMEYLRKENAEPQYIQSIKGLVKVLQNDCLLLWDGANAGEFIKAKDGFLSSTMAQVNIHLELKAFGWYYLQVIEKELRKLTVGMGIPHVNSHTLNNLLVVIPNKNEQTAIVSYLDTKTAQIDQAISQKEKMIELLKERRQIVIHEAVTKGLNPNAPKNESGVE